MITLTINKVLSLPYKLIKEVCYDSKSIFERPTKGRQPRRWAKPGRPQGVKKYLINKSISEKEIIISQITTTKVYKKNEKGNDTNEIQWYTLSQTAEVRSNDVEKVDRVSRESTELIDQNIDFESSAPEYFYTKLDELKIEMLAKATENAKARAENMVKATGNKIGSIRSAKMGVFQITPINSTEVSDWGVNDTTSLEKRVTAVVTASFAID